MYLDHYGLSEPPFRITPHTEFFYQGANRGATLEALMYAVLHGEGLVRVTGEVGAGKTMLCRVLMERLPEQVDTVYLANPSLSREEILLAIAADLKLELPSDRPNVLIRALQDALVARYAEGRQVVVLIDEAHAMPEESLEEVRLLSNLEHGHHKLMQIVLFGQPELNDKLAAQNMRQLRERITHGFELAPLHQQDIREYLMFRLRTAGYKGPDIFTPRAVRLIADESEGLTRRINILADKALIASFANGRHQVDTAEAKAAIADSRFRAARPRRWRTELVGGGLLALGLVSGVGAAKWLLPGESHPAAPAPAVHAAASPASAPPPQSTSPAAAVTPPASAQAEPVGNDPLAVFDSRLKKTGTTFSAQPPGTFTVLLSVSPQQRKQDMAQTMAQTARKLPLDELFVYPTTTRQGVPHYGLTYGLFPSQKAAMAALAGLPSDLRQAHPLLRTLGGIREEQQSS